MRKCVVLSVFPARLSRFVLARWKQPQNKTLQFAASTNWKISFQAAGGWCPDNAHLMRGHEPIRTLIVDYTNCLMPAHGAMASTEPIEPWSVVRCKAIKYSSWRVFHDGHALKTTNGRWACCWGGESFGGADIGSMVVVIRAGHIKV